MAVRERKPGGYKAGLAVCVVVIVVLGLAFIWTYQNLLNQINSLNADKTNLQNQVNSLQSQINSLNTQYQNYVATHSHSNSEYDALKSERDDLNAIVKLQKSQVLDKDKTVNLPAGGEATLSYSTPYAGYIRVDFTASGGMYFWVGSSFTGTYYARYPSTSPDTATSGSFTIPVLPGTTYLYIKHPAILIGASVTFTLTYVY